MAGRAAVGDRDGMTKTPILLSPGAGEVLRAAGNTLLIKAAAEQTAGRLSVVEYEAPAGHPGPPLHTHAGFDEAFFVLEGTLSVRLGDDAAEIGPGGFVFAPGTTPHTFANLSGLPVRFLLLCTPGGFERYFRVLAHAASAGTPPAAAALAEVSGRFGLRPA
jgi:mannose-6-phosphate isomerase-like protein (cupin superfamily)